MHGHDPPGALHHELHGESAYYQKGETGRKNPQRNQDDSKRSSQYYRKTASPFLREIADHRSTADCTESINDPGRRLLRISIVALFAEKSLIHVLGPVRHRVERRH